MVESDPHIGTKLGNFTITGVLGQGGMGVVYVAQHATLPTKAAVKVLLPEYARDHELVRRFLDEAHVAAGINDPHVVRVFDAGMLPDGSPYLVMELLEGTTLHALLAQGPLPVQRAVKIITQIAQAVAVVHRYGILHRDLKPENVHLQKGHKGDDLAKVLDFGLAKPQGLEKGLTTAGTIVGTPEYMSPEQAQGKPLDKRTDVYSFGCIAYATLAGTAPFDAESAVGLLLAHVSHPIPDVRQKRLDVPASLSSLIVACMGKMPDERPATMDAVVAALEAIGREVETTSSGATVQLAPVAAAVVGAPSTPGLAPGSSPGMYGPPAAYGPAPTATSQIGAASIVMQPPPKSGTPGVVAFIALLAVAALAGGYFFFVKNKGNTQMVPAASATATSSAPAPSASAPPEPTYGEDKNPFTWTDASVVAAGNAVYVSRCARCHGARGDGAGTDIPKGLRPRSFSDVVLPPGTLDVYYFHIIRQGIEKNGGEAMPPFKDKLNAKETWQVVTFIDTLRPKMRKVDVEKEIQAGPPNPTEDSKARGRELYATRCAGCHGDELRGDGPASVMIPEPPTDLKDGAWNDKNKKAGETDLVHIFRTTTMGYGEYMGAFSNLSTNDRWAIARYVTLVRTGTIKP